MIKANFDNKKFRKEMRNFIAYSSGYLDGIQVGKQKFFHELGFTLKEYIEEFIDSNAKVNPDMLHHIYEWYQEGTPEHRLYDIYYTVSNLGLSFKSSFRQSTSKPFGPLYESVDPFWNKAKIMEEGIPVTIKPKKASRLEFLGEDGELVYTEGPVRVENPGGDAVKGGFEKTFNLFFKSYFSQSFLRQSGIAKYLETPVLYKKNMRKGINQGRVEGYNTGVRWIMNAGLVGRS
jgi:hypothetical protein